MDTNARIGAAAAAIFVAALAAGCGSSGGGTTQGSGSTTLVGAGSTLVAPLLAKWQGEYSSAHGVTITYGAIGSGGGFQQVAQHIVDFGASDAPLASYPANGCNGCVQIPWALAATTVSYNVLGVTRPLRLSGPVIADIYLGKITSWSDAAIENLNPGVHLPSERIAVVYRSDASGDTYAFTNYLAKVSPAWRARVGGAGTAVNWPTGAGSKGNSGVTASIERTPGAIGYVAIGQAVQSNLHYADIENSAHQFVKPSTTSIAAAAATAQFARDNSAAIVDPPASAPNAYPIATFTYVIVPKSSPKLAALQKFVDYAVTKGQMDAAPLEFAPLPQNVVAKDEAIVKGL
ncbi:MAG TPA: phosphate ABC transporter substrate-binding protein PstS [Gaiellaceae bacterium]|nr:phosphate ABC transporter substrate-binding protein PstS [Gaiellaceae bacterium]